MRQPPFDYDLDFDAIDFREHPELYRIGKGEQGVLLVAPYKEVLPPDVDPVKAESAAIFYEVYVRAREDRDYQRLKREHLDLYPLRDDG